MNGTELTNQKECLNNSNTKWDGKKCLCTKKYYGKYCDNEVYDKRYKKIDIENKNVDYEYVRIKDVNSLSFDENGKSCTSICNKLSECKGVKYENGKCDLIKSDFKIKNNITIINDPFKGSFYLKTDPIIKDKIFIFKNYKLSGYFYKRNNTKDFQEIYIGVVNIVDFLPKVIINNGNLTGIWSTKPIKVEDFNNLLTTENKNVIIDRGSTLMNYSLNLKGNKFYVLYKTNKILENNNEIIYSSGEKKSVNFKFKNNFKFPF